MLDSLICIISFNPHKDIMQWTLLLKEEIKAQRKNCPQSQRIQPGTTTPEPRMWDP